MQKLFASAAAVVALAGFALVGTSPANATGTPTLPANQRMFAVDCDTNAPAVWSIDTTNANATLVGNPTVNGSDCPTGAQVNPADGKAYALYFTYGPRVAHVTTIDPQTGDITFVADVTGDTTNPWQFAITKTGAAFTQRNGQLFSLDLVSGVTTSIGSGFGFSPDSMAYNPVDDKIYAWNFDSGLTALAYTIDTTTGTATADPAHNAVLSATYDVPSCTTGSTIDSLQGAVFDANGNAWFSNDACDSELLVEDFSTGVTTYVGEINDSAHSLYTNSPAYDFYTESIFITTVDTPATDPTLPNTGMNSSEIAGLVVLGLALLVAGTTSMVIVRRRHATS